MRGQPDEIDRALKALSVHIADELSTGGWRLRQLDNYSVAIITRATQHGVMAVLGIRRTSFQWPDEWPIEVEISLGVGYEPALNLMPLLSLPPRAMLINDPRHERTSSFTITLTGVDALAVAARQIVVFTNEHASATTQDFPDAAAIDVPLEHEIESALPFGDEQTEDKQAADERTEDEQTEDDEPGASHFDTQRRLVLLAAMGRHAAARELLANYAAERTASRIDREDRRFIRQLTRWLDAGGPVAPPVEETLAQLPRQTRPPRPSWSHARAESKARRKAIDAVRAKAKGKTLDELRELITAEYGARGIDVAQSFVDVTAEILQAEQQPFGRARGTLKVIQLLKASGGDVVRLLKHRSEGDPEWLQPPDRAAYPMVADRKRDTSVDLDEAARDWLERVRTEAPQRMGLSVLIDVWLTREHATAPVVAHIGGQRVGTVRQSDTKEFDHVFRAAAIFDEDPFVRGRLTTTVGPAALYIPLPQDQGTDVAS